MMNKALLNSILHRPGVFYTLVFVICAVGIYIARFIQDKYEIIAEGFVGLAVFYLIYLKFFSLKNASTKPLELENLVFPKDMIYLFFGFSWSMIIYWATGQILDFVRYLIDGIAW